jgi:NTP pyrophosphatase (non-canonical NTP hydrolase)
MVDMALLDIQINKIVEAMNIDKRGIFKRLTKLLEEQGEMYEAYLSNNIPETVEEGIDNLIVLISLAYEVDKDSLLLVQEVANEGIEKAIQDTAELLKPDRNFQVMNYSVSIGHVADIFQKYESVASSVYKGKATAEETLLSVNTAIFNLMKFVGLISTDVDSMNELIIKKTNKWIEKVS